MTNRRRGTGRSTRSEGSSTRSAGRSSSRGTSSRGNFSRGGSSRGSKSKSDANFIRIGDISESKNGNEICKVFLPKGMDELVLKNGDVILVSDYVHDDAPNFVVGRLTLIDDN